MTILEAVVLGITQSLTEFFPVSSSAHLIILPNIMGIEESTVTFDLVLHLGTCLALIVFFWKDLWSIISNLTYDILYHSFREKGLRLSSESKYGLYVLAACLPAVTVGLLFGDYIERNLRDINLVLYFLFMGTVLMFIAELKIRKKVVHKNLNLPRALLIGFFQSLALLPGFSRSGATISGAILNGMSREEAGKFAFLMAIPVILGAAILKISEDLPRVLLYLPQTSAAFLASFFGGLLALKLLTVFLKKGNLYPFIIYRIILMIGLFFYLSY
jgi:undecaprenyl-diphosphatase